MLRQFCCRMQMLAVMVQPYKSMWTPNGDQWLTEKPHEDQPEAETRDHVQLHEPSTRASYPDSSRSWVCI